MPVEISDWNDLDNVRNDLTGDYVLVNDLDENTDGYVGIGDDFEPIGVSDFDGDAFTGTFDGDGFAIKDLIIDIDPTEEGVGLFGGTNNGGAVVVENLSVSGSVTNTDTGFSATGGLVGRHDGGTIQNCVSHVDVTALDANQVGGLVGRNGDTVTDSYATGLVEGDERAGGLVGDNGGTVTDSYATGSVEGDERVAGLVGNNTATIQTSYAVGLVTGNTDVGGLVGLNQDTVTDSYWDTESTGQDTSDGGTGLTTTEMQGSEAETNMDFDFADVWSLVIENETPEIDGLVPEEDGYPILLSVDLENQLDAQNILLVEAFDLTVETNPATDITSFEATLNGELVELDDEAEDADVFFEFGLTVTDNTTPVQVLTGPATFDELIDELESNTTYEFRAVAEAQDADNETFTDTGDTLTFETPAFTFNGQITLSDVAAESADVIVHNLTKDTFIGSDTANADGEYTINAPDAEQNDIAIIGVDLDADTDRYGRLLTTVVE